MSTETHGKRPTTRTLQEGANSALSTDTHRGVFARRRQSKRISIRWGDNEDAPAKRIPDPLLGCALQTSF